VTKPWEENPHSLYREDALAPKERGEECPFGGGEALPDLLRKEELNHTRGRGGRKKEKKKRKKRSTSLKELPWSNLPIKEASPSREKVPSTSGGGKERKERNGFEGKKEKTDAFYPQKGERGKAGGRKRLSKTRKLAAKRRRRELGKRHLYIGKRGLTAPWVQRKGYKKGLGPPKKGGKKRTVFWRKGEKKVTQKRKIREIRGEIRGEKNSRSRQNKEKVKPPTRITKGKEYDRVVRP